MTTPDDKPAPDLSTIPGRVRYARTLRGLSTRALGEQAGLSLAAVSFLETQSSGDGVKVGTIVALARVLGCAPAWLAFGEGHRPS